MLIKVLICTALVAVASGLSDGIHSFDEFYRSRPVAAAVESSESQDRGLIEDLAENKFGPEEEKDTSFWFDFAQNEIDKQVKTDIIAKKAKNIILFLGDGMSVSTLTATRVYKGQLSGKRTGEEEVLSFEKFPFSGLSKTYCTNGQVPDSACTATAYHSGVKTNIVNIGVNAHVNFRNCTASNDPANHVEPIASWAQKAGKSAGIVTTTTVTHASPSAAYAHVANRMWECDTDVANDGIDPAGCQDIASQLINNWPGENFKVILGGGRGKFLPKETTDEYGDPGQRSDGVNLIDRWAELHPEGKYVSNRDALLSTAYNETERLLGLFHTSNLEFHIQADETIQPTLAEMTEAAIKVLQNNENGYFLFVEGGRIDHGHHFTMARAALDETLEFSKAIEAAVGITNPQETLIVVTSDHGHPFSLVGYPERGNDILGLNQATPDRNGIKYPVVYYAAGPNQYLDEFGQRIDLEGTFTEDSLFPSGLPTQIGNHAGDDVGIFAYGPFAHYFSGVKEQHMIPHLMAYAACIGNGRTYCADNENTEAPTTVTPTTRAPTRGQTMGRTVIWG